ncbi:MAG: orotidine-5'-phosphate decarboxylase [Firmicutes bacterium]|nr:orotidine-5'-phosphate decarboxylase [Bacillota bacterium]
MEKIIDSLIQKIRVCKNPSVIGLDTDIEYLASDHQLDSLEKKCNAILDYNKQMIDVLCDIVPAVKVQIAYYEVFGASGMDVFAKTLQYAKQKGLYTIADAKRGDIGATAKMYAKAFLEIGAPFECDFLTVNGYLGTDGLQPFVDICKKNNKGLFVLVKTSNPSGAEIQNLVANKSTIYQIMADITKDLGKDQLGKYGYSNIGAVVGCTHPTQAEQMRQEYPAMFMLVPGYGAQGGSAQDAKLCFDAKGDGAIVNSSRGILCAYKNPKYQGLGIFEAARSAALDMQKDLA